MDISVYVTMVSVLIGFVLFGGSFASYMYGKPKQLVWGLFAAAIVFITIIPVSTAIFIAA